MRQRHIASDYTVVPDLNPSTYSATFLQLCVRAYTRKFHPIFPFLHISTIHSNKALHPAIAAVGALSFDAPHVRAQGRQLFKFVYNSVRKQIVEANDESTKVSFALFQAAVLLQCSVIIFGIGVTVDGACDLHCLIAAYAQKLGYFATKRPRAPGQFKSLTEETSGWITWSKAEETIRAILMLCVLDVQLFIAQRSKTVLDHEPSKLPQASPDPLFAASSADT